jgi:hypothetical protein
VLLAQESQAGLSCALQALGIDRDAAVKEPQATAATAAGAAASGAQMKVGRGQGCLVG